MKATHFYSILFLLNVLSSCQPTLLAEFDDRPVVESYIYANRAPLVQIRRLIPFRDDIVYSADHLDSLQVYLNDLTANTQVLLASKGNGYYAHPDPIISEHSYQLSFHYNNKQVTAETFIPTQPSDMKLSAQIMEIPVFGPRAVGGTKISELMSSLQVSWKNPEKDYYYVVTECIESNPTRIRDTTYGTMPSMRFKSEPTQDSLARLTQQSFTYLGRHRVILFHLRPEYLLLLQSVSSSSQSLEEIHANVTNGFGIFTGIHSDTLQVNVVRYDF